MIIQPGTDIGRYHILEQIGEGGMARVYKALDTNLNVEVAVKFIRVDDLPAGQIERTIARFRVEAKKMAQLSHTNIVPVTDYGEYERTPYLVMPLLSGGSLKKYIGAQMEWRTAARLIAPVAEALAYTHKKGIIHRDVKPANILLTESGDPMLTDFGIAKIIDVAEARQMTLTGSLIGTPEYMAPEQCTSTKFDKRVDIYALGIVLYELITGRKPFIADTPSAVMIKQSRDPLPRPKNFVPNLPDEVEWLLIKALAKDPNDRYKNMHVMAIELRRLANMRTEEEQRMAEKERARQELASRKRAEEEKRKKENASRLTAKQAARERDKKEKASYKKKKEKQKIRLPKIIISNQKVVTGMGVFLLVVGIVGVMFLGYMTIQEIQSQKLSSEDGELVVVTDFEPTAIKTEILRGTETPEITSSPTLEITFPPALEIGLTVVSEVDGMTLVSVPAGEFLRGSTGSDPDAESDEFPQRSIYLDAFWIDMTEVTNAMFVRFLNEKGNQEGEWNTNWINFTRGYDRVSKIDGMWQVDDRYVDYPISRVTWDGANAYCEWVGRRLPTEAEWEKAARGVDGRTYPWGEGIDCNRANYGECDEFLNTSPVGHYGSESTSLYGAYDMAGNVWEWVQDKYSMYYYYEISTLANPTGPVNVVSRVLRGGSWNDNKQDARTASRHDVYDSSYSNYIGFRCAIDAESPVTDGSQLKSSAAWSFTDSVGDAGSEPIVDLVSGEAVLNDNTLDVTLYLVDIPETLLINRKEEVKGITNDYQWFVSIDTDRDGEDDLELVVANWVENENERLVNLNDSIISWAETFLFRRESYDSWMAENQNVTAHFDPLKNLLFMQVSHADFNPDMNLTANTSSGDNNQSWIGDHAEFIP